MSSVLTLNGGVLITSNGAPLTGDATTINGYFTVTDTTDAAGGTIRTITPTEGTPVIQSSKSVTINSNTTTTITPDTGNTAMGQVVVTTNVAGGGSVTSADEKDVNFIDYDGTILYSYTKTEFASLSAMPANPSHTGLTAQGWNWSLSNAKTYVAAYGKLWIGQMYTTSDGKTHIYIHLEEGRLSPYLGIKVNGTATVEWGDGSSNSTVTGTDTVINTQHNYSVAGDYVIAISVSGSITLTGYSSYGSYVLWKNSYQDSGNPNRVYQRAIKKVEIGANTSIGTYAFLNCSNLTAITIPSGVTSIGNDAFYGCISLAAVTIPSEVTSIGTYAVRNCYSLAAIAIPSGVTSIGDYAVHSCYSLAVVTIPSEVTSIGDYAFQNLVNLAAVTIPSGVISIGGGAFQYCYSLAVVTISSGVTSIGSNAFYNCYGLGEIHFKPTTPPTVANSNAFSNLPTDCIIYVPSGKLTAYKTASNYPSSSTYTYVEET